MHALDARNQSISTGKKRNDLGQFDWYSGISLVVIPPGKNTKRRVVERDGAGGVSICDDVQKGSMDRCISVHELITINELVEPDDSTLFCFQRCPDLVPYPAC